MTPEELRASIPALEDGTYLNTGAGSPTPEPVVAAAQDALAGQGFEAPCGEGLYAAADRRAADARAALAAFLGLEDPCDLALTTSTTHGIARVAAAVPWDADDAVVRTDLEHPAGILPFERLADTRGLDVRVVETDDRGRLDPAAFGAAVADADASLALLSAVDWGYGRRHDVAAAVEAARDAGARVLVDAVQATGQYPLDVTDWGADVVATAGHKWLLGPWGAGLLTATPDAARWLEPEVVGHRSLADPAAALGGDPACELYDDARRFEVGSTDPAPHVGLVRATELLEAVGLDTVADRIERLADRLKAGVADLSGVELLSPRAHHSGLVSLRVPDAGATVAALDERDVVVRRIPSNDAVRVSVHAFNTPADVDRLLRTLGSH